MSHHGYTPTGIFIYIYLLHGGAGRVEGFIVRPSLCEYLGAYFWSFREWGGDVAVTRHTMVCRSWTIGYSSWATKGVIWILREHIRYVLPRTLATSSGIFEHSRHWVNSYDTIDKVPVYSERELNPYPPIGKRGIELTFQPVNYHGYTPTGIFIYVSTAR